jgi:cysteinyl-tRNA synthetase
LPHLNILLEDRKPGEASIWKFVDKETIMKEREAKVAAKLKKEQEKLAASQLALKKKSTPASEWFKVFESAKYSKYDDQGIPTHTNKGKEIVDGIKNKLKKEWEKQDKIYKKWLAEQEKGASASAAPAKKPQEKKEKKAD